MSGFFSAFKQFGHLGDLSDPELGGTTPGDAILDENSIAILDETGAFILDET